MIRLLNLDLPTLPDNPDILPDTLPTKIIQIQKTLPPLVASNTISKILECSICFKQMTEPKMLTCQHTFCLKCIIQVTDGCLKPMQCPLCPRKYYLTYHEAESLPNNFTIISLIEMNKTNKAAIMPAENIPSKCPNPNHQNVLTIKEASFCNIYPVDALWNCFQWEGQKQFLKSNPM